MTERERYLESLEEKRGDYVNEQMERFVSGRLVKLLEAFHDSLTEKSLSDKQIAEEMKAYEEKLMKEAEQESGREYDVYIENMMDEYDTQM